MSDKTFPYTGFSSLAIHAGHQQDPNYAHLTPIYATSTFVYDDAEQGMRRFSGKEPGYIYTRWGNPTFREAEEKIAAMETFGLTDEHGAPIVLKAYLQSSGMAAISTLMMSTLKAGDKVLSHYSLYGGTQEQMNTLLPAFGVDAVIADLRDLNIAEDMLKQHPAIKLIYLETPANPTIQCVDIEALTRLGKQYGKIIACDNTFATPYLQQPFKYGVDFVIHSTTKFLNGHGTAIGGIFMSRDVSFMKGRAYKIYKALGGSSSPFDAFLLVNGMKTLEVRMERHCSNAEKVAALLNTHKAVASVNYNGLASHPDYAVTKKQMRHPGAMMSFELKGGLQAGINFMNKLQLCTRTVSLGTCDTLLSHPASMTHYSVPKEQRERYGITDGLIRMSVGMENIADILSDLDQALK
ncbi:PLP-dependent aspartate aminotransferase family protein [Agriterribacter sp.]|uniref:trans-sulfuration enzyme family protein n=1 Tax=Agriterribacter sp. TaxID=2821509 RepID=UPI002D16C8A0|nr:PLP-dependent aspartate aminotransferase family protein [Agriterribacter sp.]HRO47023.1 PLP-dependent aspartate aminotransferase family protein [Agriterribacter sp.]HRQ17825.1 PLP-dependent aspartate aminotransferase family protein [Agriterribacter sp.]